MNQNAPSLEFRRSCNLASRSRSDAPAVNPRLRLSVRHLENRHVRVRSKLPNLLCMSWQSIGWPVHPERTLLNFHQIVLRRRRLLWLHGQGRGYYLLFIRKAWLVLERSFWYQLGPNTGQYAKQVGSDKRHFARIALGLRLFQQPKLRWQPDRNCLNCSVPVVGAISVLYPRSKNPDPTTTIATDGTIQGKFSLQNFNDIVLSP